MARTFTPIDAHGLMNELLEQATGQKTIADRSNGIRRNSFILL